MRGLWRPLLLAAAFTVTVAVGAATAQTVIVTKAPPGAAVELGLNALKRQAIDGAQGAKICRTHALFPLPDGRKRHRGLQSAGLPADQFHLERAGDGNHVSHFIQRINVHEQTVCFDVGVPACHLGLDEWGRRLHWVHGLLSDWGNTARRGCNKVVGRSHRSWTNFERSDKAGRRVLSPVESRGASDHSSRRMARSGCKVTDAGSEHSTGGFAPPG